MPNLALYSIVVLIWGSTWLPIKLQLGVVPVEASIAYRFTLASAILFMWGLSKGTSFRFSLKQHLWLFAQGAFLFCINYLFVYYATWYLTSGLVAVLFSTIVLMNIANSAIFFRHHTDAKLLVGVAVGISGICFVFSKEILNFSLSDNSSMGLILCLLSAFCASLGNMIATHNQKAGIPVGTGNAIGMGYGAVLMLLYCLVKGVTFRFDFSLSYSLSLLYLSVFGSVIAFHCYVVLLGRIGASRASYSSILFPIVALSLSTWIEHYHWSIGSVVGMLLIMAGNVLVLTQTKHTVHQK